MTCASCVHSIESALMKHPGVLEAAVALATSKGRFVYDTEKTGPRTIMQAVEVCIPSQPETLNQCWFNVGPAS